LSIGVISGHKRKLKLLVPHLLVLLLVLYYAWVSRSSTTAGSSVMK